MPDADHRETRRRVDGWVVVDKPLGRGSTQVAAKVRWAFRAAKAGHAGTLDPLATGVLAVALGEATKTVPYAQGAAKRYRFTVRWGQATATDDAEGPVVAESPHRPDRAAILAALPAFRGDVLQVPPAFSAVHVAGRRAYELARAGATVHLAARPLRVHALDLVDMPDADHAAFDLLCAAGGYVRSIARDLGLALGCHAHVTALRRTAAGPFRLDHAISFATLEEIRHCPEPQLHLLPVSTGLDDIPALAVTAGAADRLRQGQSVQVPAADPANGPVAWASLDGLPVAICSVSPGCLKPERVFQP